MANRYGEAAILAAKQGATLGPNAAWEQALERLYPTSPIARKRGSARSAFLGLCEEGLVKDVPRGDYKAGKENKAIAVRAAQLLLENTQKWSIGTLWQTATGGGKAQDCQLDVVFALWKNDLLAPPAA